MSELPRDAEAFNALRFYEENYIIQFYTNLGPGNKPVKIGGKPFKCRYCDGEPPIRTFKKDAHAVSQLLGNRALLSLDECDACNEYFSGLEGDLGKMTLPMRTIGGVPGSKRVPKIVSGNPGVTREARIEFKDGGLHLLHDAGDVSVVEDEAAKTISFTFKEQPHRPLGAYKALCKSAYALLPEAELANFLELKQWLLIEIMADSCHLEGIYDCYTSFVPGFRPFERSVFALLTRKTDVQAPYMSFYAAFKNISLQIFLPCPAKDLRLLNKEISVPPFPHYFELVPSRSLAPTVREIISLDSPMITEKRKRTVIARYDRKEKIE